MPEGDTIHKLVRTLRPALVGRELTEVWMRDRGPLPPLRGESVGEIASLGKHMLFVVGATWVLHVHLGMRGRWHRYRPGERWGRPRGAARLALSTHENVFVVFQAAVAEVLRRTQVASHPVLSRLGPDLLASKLDLARVSRRARSSGASRVSELLMDQRVACGIGNVYKNEVLFLAGCHPDASVAALSDGDLMDLYRRARELMRWNLGGRPRNTVREGVPGRQPWGSEPRLWVYGRAGRPCLRCGARVASGLRGDGARSTYWCPCCQRRPAAQPLV